MEYWSVGGNGKERVVQMKKITKTKAKKVVQVKEAAKAKKKKERQNILDVAGT